MCDCTRSFKCLRYRVGKGNRATSEPKKQFKTLLLDLYVAWLDDPELSIGVGMSKSAYKKNSRYNELFISAKMIEIVNRACSDILPNLEPEH